MSKRTRGTRKPPGRRTPDRARSATAAPRSVAPATPLEAAPDLAEATLASEPTTVITAQPRTDATQPPATGRRVRASAALAERASTEYVYVAQDIRRILVVAALIFGAMIVLWVLLIGARILSV